MSSQMLQARQNRILALRTVAARNSDGAKIHDVNAAALEAERRARMTVVGGSWHAEDQAA